jgi:citrate synthase
MVVGGFHTVVGKDFISLDGEAIGVWIKKASISDIWFRLLQGRIPTHVERRLLEAVLVSMADHGETPPSTQAARLVASTGVPLQCAIATGFLAFGDHHAGAIEGVMRFLQEEHTDLNLKDVENLVATFLSKGLRIPGFGHRLHHRDPRVEPLLKLRRSLGFSGKNVDIVLAMEKHLVREKGISLNVDGICGALLTDLGFPYQSGRAFFMAGRLPGILCHILREQYETKAFRRYNLVACTEDVEVGGEREKNEKAFCR